LAVFSVEVEAHDFRSAESLLGGGLSRDSMIELACSARVSRQSDPTS
jgi:hypothetical protein